MSEKKNKIDISISSFSGVYTPKEDSFMREFSLGTCLLKVLGCSREIGFEYEAKFSSEVIEG